MVNTSLTLKDLTNYTLRQLNHFFPDGDLVNSEILTKSVENAWERLSYCISHVRVKYFYANGVSQFNHLHSDQYAMFLYLLGNSIYEAHGHIPVAEKVFLLNKMLHGIDAFYSISLPSVFLFVHPLGTVLGNAVYNDYFCVYQNCTVGSTAVNEYPKFDKGTILYANSQVIGSCNIGKNVVFGANTFILTGNVPDNSLVTGQYPNHKVQRYKSSVIEDVFMLNEQV